ncbi:DUF402 domain-containing protein [Quadrisphaera granulorum]|uniref:DUF402 domain-containing protein n=1 Tax=Quadrisphaera granulorum TaxID=317664 RepID=UPI0011B72244|nr:DUF402 domain-containing protein [Quadrisphaera granulorum]
MIGDEVQLAFTKYDGSPHWHVPTRLLGDDEHGTWLHSPAGTRTWRPGLELIYDRPTVVCLPRHQRRERDGDQHWVATLYDTAPAGAMETYVDITTPAVWSAGRVTTVDVDLDVVQRGGEEPFIDDKDEFDLHRIAYGYPEELVTATRSAAAAVLAAVTWRTPPFDGVTARRWLALADPTWPPVPPPSS